MNWVATREGAGIALEALRSNKVRAALTILGIVIGVATVMAMAAMIGGINSSVTAELEAIGPDNFVVARFDQTQLDFSSDRPPWEGKPQITLAEAELIEELPSVGTVTVAVNGVAEARRGTRGLEVSVQGNDADWTDYTRGDFVQGRNFLPTDVERSVPAVVLAEEVATALFEGRPAVGEEVRLRGRPFTIVGVFRPVPNVFQALDQANNWVVVPHSSATKQLDVDDRWTQLLVVPAAGFSQERAMDDVTAALRISRGLRPGDENDFALIRQEAFADLFDRITGIFFLVMLVLSSIGLMVGGVGVVAIMMISVTERTREIGVRKALGATRREILWQFLVESMTVTVIGGLIGMLLGGGGALLLATLTPIPASVPLWSVAAALGVSALTGIGFGLYPANKAARLDPVEALRYE